MLSKLHNLEISYSMLLPVFNFRNVYIFVRQGGGISSYRLALVNVTRSSICTARLVHTLIALRASHKSDPEGAFT